MSVQMSVRRTAKTVSFGVFTALFLGSAPALAADFSMSGSAGNFSGLQGLRVTGSSGRFDRVESSKAEVALKLTASASGAPANRKIVASKVYLKHSGISSVLSDAGDGNPPTQSFSLDRTIAIDIDPSGPVAQNAIALCNGNGNSGKSLVMSSPVVWRLTSGRFNFKWMNYDKVAPSPEIIANPDFYADQESQELEIAAEIGVTCDGDAAVAAVQVPKSEPVKKAAKRPAIEPAKLVTVDPASQENVEPPKAVASKSVAEEQPKIAPQKSVSLEPAEAPICNGGMVRKTGSGETSFACLCPGNTERVETGTNAFACEKRNGRRS